MFDRTQWAKHTPLKCSDEILTQGLCSFHPRDCSYLPTSFLSKYASMRLYFIDIFSLIFEFEEKNTNIFASSTGPNWSVKINVSFASVIL